MTNSNGFLFSGGASPTQAAPSRPWTCGGLARCITRIGAIVLAALFGAAAPGQAQNPPLLDRPNVDIVGRGDVYASLALADGSVLFGGHFQQVDGVPRQSLFKRRPDGTLDPDWHPAVDGYVYAFAADAAGNVYVGGYFTTIGGQVRRNLAKLSASGAGAVDQDWNPSPDSSVAALAIDAAGNVYVGGNFTAIGGRARPNLAKLAGDRFGVADPDWNPAPDNDVNAIVLDTNGNLFVGGRFHRIGGQGHMKVAKLSAGGTGAVDAAWAPSLVVPEAVVNALVLDRAGHLFIGGSFHRVNTLERDSVAKLSASGTGVVDADWKPSVDGEILTMVIDAGGDICIGGRFVAAGGLPRRSLARLSASGSGAVDPDWNPSPDDLVETVTIAADGTIYIGGWFETFAGLPRLGLAVVLPDGTTGDAMDAEWPGAVNVIARQADGGTLVGGDFRKARGLPRRNLLRLLADGRLDPDWKPAADRPVDAFAVDADDDVYAGGRFETVDGLPRKGIVKLAGTGAGTVDPAWKPSLEGYDGSVAALAIDTAGSLYVVGEFDAVDGLPRRKLVKLATRGAAAIDPNWKPLPDFPVSAIVVDAAGDLYVGGDFGDISGVRRERIAKLAGSNGAVDPLWNPSADSWVGALALDAAGNLFVSGDFATFGGLARKRLAKVSTSGRGVVDPLWNPSADALVFSLAIDPAGDVYAAGHFTTIGGQPRVRIARLAGGGSGAAADWKPRFGGIDTPQVNDLEIDANGSVWVGGWFATIDAQPRMGVAAFGVIPDPVFVDGFEPAVAGAIESEG